MFITKQKFLEIINDTVLKTCRSCGRNLSIKDQFRIKEEIFKKYDETIDKKGSKKNGNN